ncbi:MAG: serpin family protein [Ruminococcaceae bacterium]|nr:serpin family protein [Oscillospiraceae bacterium]
MKKEQILDMIGEAPEEYVKDAKEYKKRRRIPRAVKWLGGIAAVMAIVLTVHHTGIPLIVSAKAISTASEPRITARPGNGASDERFDAWRAERDARRETADAAIPPIAVFAEQASAEIIAGADSTNRVWSPINAYISLAMTAELAGGEAQAELLDLLGAVDTAELRRNVSAVWETVYADNGNEISVLANSLWLDDDLAYDQEKMDVLAHDYYASVYQGSLGSERTNKAITNWMKNQTGGLLTDRTGKVTLPVEDQMLVMASTIYFQAKWKDEFSAGLNTEGVFHTAEGDVDCTFMNRKLAEMYYYWAEDFAAVALHMKNGSAMWFILPDEGKTVDDVLTGGDYMNMITGGEAFPAENKKWMKVNLIVPQFDVSAGIDVKAGLMNLGLSRVFDWTQAEFSDSLQSTTSPYPVYLAGIHQDTRVQIDEKGVKAASYIELNFGAGAAAPPDEIIDFVLDRPFVFAVTKSGIDRNIPLFVGTVNKP